MNELLIIKLNTFLVEKVSSKETLPLLKMSRKLYTSYVSMTHLAGGLCLNTLLTLKVENYLICFLGTQTRAVDKME
jgi:hypothetical protein